MTLLKKNSLGIVIFFFVVGCQKEEQKQDPFLVSKQNIGLLTDSSQVKDLRHIFKEDSITKYIGGDEFTGDISDFEIFDKSGELLLALTPLEDLDSTSTIESVRIISPKFKTFKGLNSNSIYRDIKDNYTISSIENTLRNIIISVNDINAYFTIDKQQLPLHMRNDLTLKISKNQIPDNAQIKDFYLRWY